MPKSILTPEVRAVLENSRIEGQNLYLPAGQLERKLYQDVDKHIKNCGGKWNKSAKAHIFDSCPKEKLGMVLESGVSVDEKTVRQSFFTPPEIAKRVAELAEVKGHIVLEPSAGLGSLADACMDAGAQEAICYEIDFVDGKKIGQRYVCFIEDFLNAPVPDVKFQRCCINPPFTRNQDIKHVLHVLENWLAPSGRLVAIMPDKPHPKLDKYNPVEYKLGAGAFKSSGTMIATKIIVIDLP